MNLNDTQLDILKKWYEILDVDYGEHGDPESPCEICTEAMDLGLIDDSHQEEVGE